MDSDELKFLLKDIPSFTGVYSIDTLPKECKNDYKGCGVVNFQGILEPGSHWVCYYSDNKNVEYFDSFGFPPPEEILVFLKRNQIPGKEIVYNSFRIQDIN